MSLHFKWIRFVIRINRFINKIQLKQIDLSTHQIPFINSNEWNMKDLQYSAWDKWTIYATLVVFFCLLEPDNRSTHSLSIYGKEWPLYSLFSPQKNISHVVQHSVEYIITDVSFLGELLKKDSKFKKAKALTTTQIYLKMLVDYNAIRCPNTHRCQIFLFFF